MRRIARRAAAPWRPFGRTLQALGRADQRVLVALRTCGHGPVGTRVAQGLGYFGEMGSGWATLALAGAVARPDRRRQFMSAAMAAPIAILANYSVKLTVGRERPLIDDHPPLARAPSKLSFPSAHSTSSVAGAVALARVAPEAKPALYTLAAAVCLGRPYLGMHYPSDVLAGVALGYLLGRLYPLPDPQTTGPAAEASATQPPGPAEAESLSTGETGREAEGLPGGSPQPPGPAAEVWPGPGGTGREAEDSAGGISS